MTTYFKYLLILLLLSGCMTLKRAERKIERFTERFPALVVKDTISVDVSVITPEIRSDTTFFIEFDTITLEKEKLIIRAIRIRDSIYLEGLVKIDTIREKIIIPIEKIVVKKPTWWERWGWIFWLLIILAILYFFRSFIKEFVKKILFWRKK